MNPFELQAPIEGIQKIILVGSGKGGVGKSTVAVNLAMALAKDHNVGILDADIYGPSLPRLMGALHQKPNMSGEQKIDPLIRHGIKLMSMGFLIPENTSVVWRGPMLFKAMDQFFRDVSWGKLDYLIIDLPPGTGDVALTIAQKVPVHGAIVVSTPQNMALMDATRAIDMFEKINVPLLGVIENMSYLKSPEGEKVQLFPRGELHVYLDAHKIPLLGAIPFDPSMAISCESGIPYLLSAPDSEASTIFKDVVKIL